MTQLRDTGFSPPVIFRPELDATLANVRGTYFSGRFLKPHLIVSAAVTFEDNTNDAVRCRLWLCNSDTTRTVIASTESSAGTVPSGGRNLFSSIQGGTALEYITGDGPDAIFIPLGLEVSGGFHLGVDLDNQDTPNVHAVTVRWDVREIIG
jgi:hypothetical protein